MRFYDLSKPDYDQVFYVAVINYSLDFETGIFFITNWFS